MLTLENIHISTGGNRHPSAADWTSQLFAFGAGSNIALWHPRSSNGVSALLRGHTDAVTVVRIISRPDSARPWILSGSADKTLRLWTADGTGSYVQTFEGSHDGAVNTAATLVGAGIFITGAADGTVKVWRILDGGKAEVLQTIVLKPRILPLASAVVGLDDGGVVVAVAGTATGVYLFHSSSSAGKEFKHAATLAGHEGWIRSLDFVRESEGEGSDVLLASASQDKYTRLWRVRRGKELPSATAKDPALEGVLGRSLSNKPHWLGEGEGVHSVTFEALLIGHEDWIYTAQWRAGEEGGPKLLTTSADNSVAVWIREEESGFWICQSRLGEISAQKGSTTATGSTGGFWIGLWGPEGKEIASLGRTGSWRIWTQSPTTDSWEQGVGISGHTKEVKSLAWSKDGSYLLSTGSDQTTRLLAPWRKEGEETWHELARPQIHGYDLKCIDTLSSTQFISGADEKLLRVFNKPRKAAMLLSNLSGQADAEVGDLPEIANMPVLGLSNKAITVEDLSVQQTNGDKVESDESNALKEADFETDHPPYEDVLSKYTLWPEHEKLYGHGYEISAVAASSDGALVATACRASSIDHAVIRLYETKDWREIKPSLSSHSLTVTSLSFSPSNDRLLSVGRDRQWTVFARQEKDSTTFTRLESDPKGHSRMILDCSWAPSPLNGFATAGRDKSVKIWIADSEEQGGYKCKLTLPLPVAATAVAFAPTVDTAGRVLLAAASEAGDVLIACVDPASWTVIDQKALEDKDRPSGAVTALRWRPGGKEGPHVLAVSSEDHSVRLYRVQES